MDEKSSVAATRKQLTRSGPSIDCMTTQSLWKTRTADAFLAAGGAAGSMALLQAIQDYLLTNTTVTTPIIGGFLAGSAIKFFLNRNPPSLEAFWKSTAASVVIGSSVHTFLWRSNGEDGATTTIISKEYSSYLILFCMILFWKLDVGSIWGAGKSLAVYIAFQSGSWGNNASANGDFRSLIEDFPIWYILRPYLLGHFYLYICALGLASIRRRVRIYLLRQEFFSTQKRSIRNMNDRYLKNDLPTDKQKLRVLFDRMDTNGDGRLDATELKLALRASLGVDLPLEDCDYMIGSADTDGDGTLDFYEFCESVDHILLLR